MSNVVVVGAGLGGLPAAYELRHRLGPAHQVTLVSASPRFTFVPGLIQVALGHTSLDHIQIDLAPLCQRHGLAWISGRVERIDPIQRVIEVQGQPPLPFDYAVIASGAVLDQEAIPGLSTYGHSVCTPDHAVAAWAGWRAFCEHPGDLVVGAAPGTGCLGPAYEFVLLAEADLRRRGIRDQVRITYLTPEPYIGHMGIVNVQGAQTATQDLMHERGIYTVTDAHITDLTPDAVTLADGRTYPSGYSMVLPAFKGAAFVRASGLGNENGYLPITATLRHRDYERIYGVGVSVHLPQPDHTPVPLGMPKSGQMAEAMAMVAAHNIAVDLGVIRSSLRVPTLEALCFADFGETGIAYIAAPVYADPETGQRRYSYAVRGQWVPWAKQALEYYFMAKMRFGLGLPWFERLGLKALFGLALSQPYGNRDSSDSLYSYPR